jgi:hypothetical protein
MGGLRVAPRSSRLDPARPSVPLRPRDGALPGHRELGLKATPAPGGEGISHACIFNGEHDKVLQQLP